MTMLKRLQFIGAMLGMALLGSARRGYRRRRPRRLRPTIATSFTARQREQFRLAQLELSLTVPAPPDGAKSPSRP